MKPKKNKSRFQDEQSHQTFVKERGQRLANRGASLLQEGKNKEAMTILERALRLMPDDVPIAINLGGACVMNKQFSRAIEILERARDQEPENEMIWINLGAAYLGNPILADDDSQHKAIVAFERAIEINPIAHNVHYNLGLIHRDRGEIEQAKRRFEQAIQANPLDQHARNALHRLLEFQASPAEEPEA